MSRVDLILITIASFVNFMHNIAQVLTPLSLRESQASLKLTFLPLFTKASTIVGGP
jgi:hypothetical protein